MWHRTKDSGVVKRGKLEYQVQIIDPEVGAHDGHTDNYWTPWQTTEFELIDKPVAENINIAEAAQNQIFTYNFTPGVGNDYRHIENAIATEIQLTNADNTVGIASLASDTAAMTCNNPSGNQEVCTVACGADGVCNIKFTPVTDHQGQASIDYTVKTTFNVLGNAGPTLDIWSDTRTITMDFRPIPVPENDIPTESYYAKIWQTDLHDIVIRPVIAGTCDNNCGYTIFGDGYPEKIQLYDATTPLTLFEGIAPSCNPVIQACEFVCTGDPTACDFQVIPQNAGAQIIDFNVTVNDMGQATPGRIQIDSRPIAKVVAAPPFMGYFPEEDTITGLKIQPNTHYTFDTAAAGLKDVVDINHISRIAIRQLASGSSAIDCSPTACPNATELNLCTNGVCDISALIPQSGEYRSKTNPDNPALWTKAALQYKVEVTDPGLGAKME